MRDTTGNLPPIPGLFPDYSSPIVRNTEDGVRELILAPWGMSSPVFALKGRHSDSGVTNVRNFSSPHWRRWLSVESRCVVPSTSFAENEVLPDGSRPPVWLATELPATPETGGIDELAANQAGGRRPRGEGPPRVARRE